MKKVKILQYYKKGKETRQAKKCGALWPHAMPGKLQVQTGRYYQHSTFRLLVGMKCLKALKFNL